MGLLYGRAGRLTALFGGFRAGQRTMQPNLWPSMNGGGVEQVGATQAVNDMLCQSVNGKIHLFPGWEPGRSSRGSLSADIHLNVLSNNYDRVCL
jgi:hypothetical protein